MRSRLRTELGVGAFLLSGLLALVALGIYVADVGPLAPQQTYQLQARFDNIGSLKVRAPVRIGGVQVGRVSAISLDTEDYLPLVTVEIDARYNELSENSALAVRTSGLLGEQYLALEPGFFDEQSVLLSDGDAIYDTRSALVLEKLIAQYLFDQGE